MKKYINIVIIALFCVSIVLPDVQLLEDDAAFQRNWINLYGAVQKVLGKKAIENFTLYKTDYGKIVEPRSELGEDRIAADVANIEQITDFCAEREIPVYYVTSILPITEDTELLPGVQDYSAENASALYDKLCEAEIPLIDLRNKECIQAIASEDLFYRTDHHWTVETCFAAYQEIIWQLEKDMNWQLDAENIYTNRDCYEVMTLKNMFLGSYGVKVGEYYAGMDDFVVYIPTFDTDLQFEAYDQEHQLTLEKSGSFLEALMDNAILEDENYYNKYNAFSNGGYVENRVVNHLAENDKKVLLISHSYGRPLTQYLSMCFREIRNLDPQEGRYEDDYLAYIEEYQPDLVLILTEFEGEVVHTLPTE